MAYLIGIDVGTSGTKSLICDEKGKIYASVTKEHPSSHPEPLWSEQNPDDWWRSTVEAVQAALKESQVDPKEIKGIGLSGQMHGLVMLDENCEVLRPAILWNDQRTAAECAEITSKIGAEKLIELTCNPALTGFTAPKILWVRKNEPEIYEKTRKILLPKDYIRFCLTGVFATEVSDASGTLLLDVRARRWSDAVLSALEIDKELLPDCYESVEVSGQLSDVVAAHLGIPAGIPVVGGGGDQAAQAVGSGIVKTGIVSATIGTSGVVFAFSDIVQTDPQGRAHTFCHAVPGKWHVMGVMLSAGGSFQWFRNNLSAMECDQAKRMDVDPYEILCEEAEEAAAGCEGLIFLPYLTGERTPHADPNARGAWIGLTARHGKAEMIRSLLEGITYGMKDSLEIIKGMGIPVTQIRVSGGGARSDFWRQLQADVYGQPVCVINETAGAAFGAALLAGVGTGVFGSVDEACQATIKVVTETPPDPGNAKVYRRYYSIYQQLYRSLKNDFETISIAVAGLAGQA
ncbi:MAG: xylulokinase [Planctomycetes bacterium]|nr:xylulokinase [Planctomycetota bacterium]